MLEVLGLKRANEDARMRGVEGYVRASTEQPLVTPQTVEDLYGVDLTKTLPIRIITDWLAVCKTLAGFLVGKTSKLIERANVAHCSGGFAEAVLLRMRYAVMINK